MSTLLCRAAKGKAAILLCERKTLESHGQREKPDLSDKCLCADVKLKCIFVSRMCVGVCVLSLTHMTDFHRGH